MGLPAVAHTTEFQRVAALPRRVWAPAELEWVARELTSILKTPAGTESLWPIQAQMLHDAGVEGGLYGAPVGVGDGKTIPSMLLPLVWGSVKPVLLVPGGLEEKTKRDRLEISKDWRVPNSLRIMSTNRLSLVQYKEELMQYEPDAIIIDEAHKFKNLRAACTRVMARYMLAHPMTKVAILTGSPGEELRQYAHLILWALKTKAPVPTSREEIDEWSEAMSNNEFAAVAPGALLSFCTEEERRTMRPRVAARLGFQRRLTETPGVVTTKGDGNFVGASIYVRGIMHKVAKVTEENFKILRGDATDRENYPGWKTPDGWELTEGVDVWRHAQELALGLHYVWINDEVWKWLAPILKSAKNKPADIVRQIARDLEPMIELVRSVETRRDEETTFSKLATVSSTAVTKLSNAPSKASAPYVAKSRDGSKSIGACASTTTTEPDVFEDFFASLVTERSESSATQLEAYQELFNTCLKVAKPPTPWMQARAAWNKFVRDTINKGRTYDSELHVANACDAGRLPADTLTRWRAVRDMFTPNVKAIWHDTSALETCRDWMKRPGIVWTEHGLFAKRLAEFTGATYYGAGGFSDDGRYIEDGDAKAAVIASIDANREGKNLQHLWHRNLTVCPPSNAEAWEQGIIGRTHRTGQKAEEVTVDALLGCRENWDACQKAIESARVIYQMQGKRYKLLIADVTLPTEDEIDRLESFRWQK